MLWLTESKMPQTSLRITGYSSGSKVDKLGLGLPWLLGYGVSVWGAYPERLAIQGMAGDA